MPSEPPTAKAAGDAEAGEESEERVGTDVGAIIVVFLLIGLVVIWLAWPSPSALIAGLAAVTLVCLAVLCLHHVGEGTPTPEEGGAMLPP